MSAEPRAPRQNCVEVVPTEFKPTGHDFRRHTTQRMNSPVAQAELLRRVLIGSADGRRVVVVCGDARTARLVAVGAQLRGRASEFLLGTSKHAHVRDVLALKTRLDVLSMTSATYTSFVHSDVVDELFNMRTGYTDCILTGLYGYVVNKVSKPLNRCRVCIVTDAVGTQNYASIVSQLKTKLVEFSTTPTTSSDVDLDLAKAALQVSRSYDGRVFNAADFAALAAHTFTSNRAGDATAQRAAAIVNLRAAAFVNDMRTAIPSSVITPNLQVSGKVITLTIDIALCE